MKILKYGHCCLLIEEGGLRVLTDPGSYSTLQSAARGIDLILITHEHPDHLHLDSLREVLKHNPKAEIVTNAAAGKILAGEKIAFEVLEHTQSRDIGGVRIEGFGNLHAEIYGEFGRVQNTGYFIADKFFYPGDDLYDPGKKIGILALPVAGPWLRLKDAIDYAKKLKPSVCFPVHDGMLKFPGAVYLAPEKFLAPAGIRFQMLEAGQEAEIVP